MAPALRRPLCCTLFLLALAFACPKLFAQTSPAGPQKWALLIGIDAYKDKNRINNLGAAAADARALKAALIEAAGFPEQNVRLLVSDANPERGESTPEYNTILRELATLTQRVKPGDTVFVLYAGHGIETGGKSYLLPYDTDAFDDSTLTDTAIDTAKFRERLQSVHAGTLILAFDMCRTNPVSKTKGIEETNKLTIRQVRGMDFSPATTAAADSANPPAHPVVITMFACSPEERSYEWPEKGRGYFSYFLEEGLRGSASDKTGTVHLDRLVDYVASHVEQTVLHNEGREQTPFMELKGTDTGDNVILARGVFPVAAPVITKSVDTSVIDTVARFRLFVSPTNATVTADGDPLDPKTAAVDLGVAKRKTVTLHIEAPGYIPQDRQVPLTRGLNNPLVVMLDPDRSQTTDSTLSATSASSATPEDVTIRLRGAFDGGAQATFQREDGGSTLTVRVSAITSDPWRVRAGYRTMTIKEGRSYEICFRARADSPRTIQVSCLTADSLAPRSIGLNNTLQVGTDFQKYRLRFQARSISGSANYAPLFAFGNQTGKVQISNLTLTTLDN